MHRLLAPAAVAVLLACVPAAAAAATIGGNPGPQYNYVCPHADGQTPLDCYFDAVQHLYTMCRNVKAIEIVEFGYEDSAEGPNNSKYEYCVDKQMSNMKAPLQAALKESRVSQQATEGVRSLHERWQGAMRAIQWKRGESDDDYKARLASVYVEFKERIEGIRTIVAIVRERTSPIGTANARPLVKPGAGKPARPQQTAVPSEVVESAGAVQDAAPSR